MRLVVRAPAAIAGELVLEGRTAAPPGLAVSTQRTSSGQLEEAARSPVAPAQAGCAPLHVAAAHAPSTHAVNVRTPSSEVSGSAARHLQCCSIFASVLSVRNGSRQLSSHLEIRNFAALSFPWEGAASSQAHDTFPRSGQ